MDSTCQIRIATQEDLTTLLEMGHALFLVEKEYEPLMKYSKEEVQKRYASQLTNSDALLLLLYIDNQPAGYCYAFLEGCSSLDTTQPKCKLEVVYLSPLFRRRGFSSLLISEVIAWAKERNALQIKTDIFADNQASIRAFEKQGFKAHNISFILNTKKEAAPNK